MKLSEILSPKAVIADLGSTTKEGVLEELAATIASLHPEHDKGEITAALLEREKLGSTGIENGVAIPHAKLKNLDHIILAVGRSRAGIEFQAHDGKPSSLFFVLLAPDSSAGVHLKTLARLSHLLKEEGTRNKLLEASTDQEMYDIIKDGDDKLTC